MNPNNVSILGRKIFFLNLSTDVKERIISVLREEEYEVYFLDNYRYAKNALREYPDSIFFLQIDDHSQNELDTIPWFNFLDSFTEDENLCTILIGIISKRMPTNVRSYFMLKLPLAAGMLTIRNGTESVLENIKEVLKINGAKGRRQYVRAHCPRESTDCVQYELLGVKFDMKMNDLSCAGISCTISNETVSFFQPNTVLKGVNLYLGRNNPIKCNCAVFGIKPIDEKYSLLVLLLLPTTAESTKSLIRSHVYDLLQTSLETVIFKNPLDETEYSKDLPKAVSEIDEEAFLLEEID